jgi:hypothetical protein
LFELSSIRVFLGSYDRSLPSLSVRLQSKLKWFCFQELAQSRVS